MGWGAGGMNSFRRRTPDTHLERRVNLLLSSFPIICREKRAKSRHWILDCNNSLMAHDDPPRGCRLVLEQPPWTRAAVFFPSQCLLMNEASGRERKQKEMRKSYLGVISMWRMKRRRGQKREEHKTKRKKKKRPWHFSLRSVQKRFTGCVMTG